MANPRGNPNLRGVKGRSGRKSARIELAKIAAIRDAWIKVAENVKTMDVKEIALPLALKDMTVKIGNSEGGNLPTPILYAIPSDLSDKKDSKPEEEN